MRSVYANKLKGVYKWFKIMAYTFFKTKEQRKSTKIIWILKAVHVVNISFPFPFSLVKFG